MSADNMICIQKRGDRWWVWMRFASSRNAPSKQDKNFETRKDAADYAFDWYQKEAIVEYGVVALPDTKTRKRKAL